ncbi:hypothetical protein B566_EDAN002854 [Ephemera danica]|nr:hypothetical protein B566_EDAN002854 [Ephemera danica]
MSAKAEKEKKKKSPPKTVTFDLDMLNQLNAKAGKDKIKTEVADLEEQGEKIVSPSTKKMPKVSEVPTTVNTVTSKKSGVQKLSWDFSIPAVSAKESLVKGYKLRNRMAKQIIVTSTAPKVLRKEKSGANFVATFIKKEPEEERQIEEQPKVAFENNQELPECSVNLIDCVKSSVEVEFLSIPEDLELSDESDDEEHALIFQTHDQAGYQLRQRPPKDPLKPKKYRFKKLPPELKPEPLIDYEFEVTDEVDALSLDEIVIPDSLPYEFEPLAVSMASSSHHEDIYEAAPIASSSHYTESSGLAEASNLEVKPVTPVKRTYMKKKIQPPSQVYNLRKKKNQQLPEDKQVEKMSQIFDYDILNTRVVLKKMPGKNYWS